LQRYSDSRAGHGVVIGVEQADSLRDIAVVSTILAAAPYQRVRYHKLKMKQQQLLKQLEQMQSDQDALPSFLQKQKQLLEQLERKIQIEDSHNLPFLLSRSDLKRYRRAPTADLMLLILLDYTSLRDSNWQDSLYPYLVRAYMERAAICIVQVGRQNASHELQAEVVRGRNILAPEIDDAIRNAVGRATPLAHGFDLTLQILRHALQHGRSTVYHVQLLIISDGRGNVPLEDSRIGRITQPVYRKGIEDAFGLAQQLQDFKDLEKVLLNPQPEQYADLPLLLAETMGAEVEDIPHLDSGEVKV
jgi:magnesium chelatase subunit D